MLKFYVSLWGGGGGVHHSGPFSFIQGGSTFMTRPSTAVACKIDGLLGTSVAELQVAIAEPECLRPAKSLTLEATSQKIEISFTEAILMTSFFASQDEVALSNWIFKLDSTLKGQSRSSLLRETSPHPTNPLTIKTLNIGTPRPATVVVLNIKPFNFTIK